MSDPVNPPVTESGGAFAHKILIILIVHRTEENLTLLDHAEFITRALFDSVIPLLEVPHFRIQCGIADFELFVGFRLNCKLLIDLPNFQPTTLAQP